MGRALCPTIWRTPRDHAESSSHRSVAGTVSFVFLDSRSVFAHFDCSSSRYALLVIRDLDDPEADFHGP